MVYLVITAVVVGVVVTRGRSKKENPYGYYQQQYDSYMKEKERKSKPRRSICLLIAFLLTLVYLGYMAVCMAEGMTPNMNEWESLGWLMGVSLMLPHLVCVGIALVFNFMGWIVRSRSCALVCAVLYAVSMVMMPLYFMFVVVQVVLAFVGFALMKQRN